jgi:DNA invertase Pin-like site-specific DNA recombinase
MPPWAFFPEVSAMSTSPVAFSYVRFSTREQRKGDSLRRQTKATADWCGRNGVTREVFQIHLVHDADSRRNELECLERLLTPLKKLITLAIALEFHVQVEF